MRFKVAAGLGADMRLTIRLLGTEVFHVTTDEEPDEDIARDLSGGNLGSERIDVEAGDIFLGFTNGRGDE